MGRLSVAAGVLPGDPSILEATAQVVELLDFDVEVISWLRPGAIVAGTDRPSLHGTGDALDLRPKGYKWGAGSPCGYGLALDPESMREGDQLAEACRRAGIFQEVLWRTCTGGNHYDHVHVGGDVAGSAGGSVNVGDSSGAKSSGGGVLGRLLDPDTWIRAAEVIGGSAAVIAAIILVGKEGS